MTPTILTQQPILKERLSDEEAIRALSQANLLSNNRGYYESLLTVLTHLSLLMNCQGLEDGEK